DLVVVLEAMKMEQPLNAHRSGTVKGLSAEVGTSVSSGAAICESRARTRWRTSGAAERSRSGPSADRARPLES
ncbi:hypothetical protein DLE01_12500, partial [Streptomyces sp. FT05W]